MSYKYTMRYGNDNKYYDIYPSIKIVEKLNEELDMVEFTLTPIEYELDLDFKKYNGLIPITLYINDTVYKYLYLSFYKQVTISYSPVKKYKYVFQCVSPTIVLQRITLPNKLITQPIGEQKRTIYEEIIKIRDVYCDWLVLVDELQELLNVPCPQMQFTKSTLHEILISLFAVVNLIPKMLDFDMLGYMSLEGNDYHYTKDEIIRIEKQNSIDSYCDALDYDIENAISDGKDITTTWINPTSDEAMLTTENFLWKMPSEIYEISKVEAMANYSIRNSLTPEFHDKIENGVIDITNYVVPKIVWDTFKESIQLGFFEGNYKRNFLYYDVDKIYGNYETKTWIGVETDKAIYNAMYWSILGTPTDNGGVVEDFQLKSDYRNVAIRVTYKSELDNSRIVIIKNGIENPKNFMISNQDDAYIDLINFGKQKQELINRMGNEVAVGQANYKINDNNVIYSIPYVGDWLDNYIITQREMQLKENNMLVNYQLTKDYVLKTGYSGLNQMKRFTSIDTTNTMIRNDVLLLDYKFSFNKINYDYSSNDKTKIAELIVDNYGNEELKGKNLHLIKTFDDKGVIDLKGNEFILVNSQNKFIANCITSQFNFETNAKVGDYILIEDDTKAYSKIPVRYVNNNGEFKNINIWFAEGEQFRDNKDLEIVRKYPLVELTEEFDSRVITKLINKDNREITAISMQIITKNNIDEEIFVYDNFLKHCSLYPHDATTLKVYGYYYEKQEDFEKAKYNALSKNIVGEEVLYANIIADKTNRSIEITNASLIGGNNDGYYVIAVVDHNNNLLLGINANKQNFTNNNLKIYLNN